MKAGLGGVFEDFLVRWVGQVRRHAVFTVIAAAALTVAAFVYVSQNLKINTDTTEMISAEVPFRRNAAAFRRAFPLLGDLIVVVVDGPSPEEAEGAAGRLAAILSARPRVFRSVYFPGGEPFFKKNGLLYLKKKELEQLARRMAKAAPFLGILAADPSLRGMAAALDMALAHPENDDGKTIALLLEEMRRLVEALKAEKPLNFSWRRLLDGSARERYFLLVQPGMINHALDHRVEAVAVIRRLAPQAGIRPENGFRLRLTGSVPIEQEELKDSEVGGLRASLLSFILVLFLLVVGLRSFSLMWAATVSLLVGLIWTAALAALVVGQLNIISVAFAVLFIGLGVDFGIHVSLRYREEVEKGASQEEALDRTVSGVGKALGLSALAAAAGFYSFLPTDYLGLAELGLIAGNGMFVAFLVNLTVLPALVVLLTPPKILVPGKYTVPLAAHFIQRHAKGIAWLALFLGLAGAASVPFLRFDFNPMNLKNPNAESVSTFFDLARDPDTSPYVANVLVKNSKALEGLVASLRKRTEVGRVISLHDFVPGSQSGKLETIDDMALFLGAVLTPVKPVPAPDSKTRATVFRRFRNIVKKMAARDGRMARSAARLDRELQVMENGDRISGTVLKEFEKRLMVNFQAMLDQLRFALRAERITLDGLPKSVRKRWIARNGQLRAEVHPRRPILNNDALERFVRAGLSEAPGATGMPIIISEAGRSVVAAFQDASLYAFGMILVLLFLVLRRAMEIILVLLPVVLAGLWTSAASVFLDMPFNFANIIALPLLLGLGVSSGIQIVLRRREEGGSAQVLASSTSRAVLFSALTTIAAFGSLAFSGHRGMSSMGQLLAISITFMLLATLVVLPSLMMLFSREKQRAGKIS